jgi:cob(I)alamin adenosyltransferase
MKLRKGYIQLYTGDGKGKTTAAFGLALRAVGAGLKVCIFQFAKGIESGELKMVKKLSGSVLVRQFGARSFIRGKAGVIDRTLAERGLAAAEKAITGGRYDVIILDELCIACHYRMIQPKTVLEVLANRPAHVEVVITGRKAPKEFADAADLVTEMKEIKHYYCKGVKARRGIEY